MLDDGTGRAGEPSVPHSAAIPAQRRRSPVLAAPVTVGRPVWRRRHLRAALAVDAGALGSLPLFHLLWQHAAARPLVAAVLSAVALSLAGRGLLSLWLHRQRRHGRAMSSLLVVGTHEAVAGLAERTRSAPSLGWRVRGACTSTGLGPDETSSVAGVPVLGDLDGVAALALTERFDAVAVCPTPGWSATRLQQLARDLDCSRTELLVDPLLVRDDDLGVRATALVGLPLVRLTPHVLGGPRRVLKEATDCVGALVLLMMMAPVLVCCAVAVRRDGGPALVRRIRVGRHGRTFSMLSFRTTAVDGLRMTPVGRSMRARCLDELPQLLNVLGGSMALVGPRPPVPGENATQGGTPRPLLVKPGITGLDHEASDTDHVAVDLSYAQQWSPALDAKILLRTLRTALHSSHGSGR